jgi:alpha-L-rhamnosidase
MTITSIDAEGGHIKTPVALSRGRGWEPINSKNWNGGLRIPAGRRICFDFGTKRVGRIELDLVSTTKGTVRGYPFPHPEAEVPVVFSSENYGKPEFPLTWGTQISGPLQFTHGTGSQKSCSPKTYAFRYLSLLSDRDIVLEAVRLHEEPCPVALQGSFECSDPAVNRAWEMGARTLLLCTQPALDSQQPIGVEGDYVIWDGCRRDREVWVGDLRPSALALYSLSSDASAVRTSLRLIAERRFSDGLIPASASSRQVFFEYALWWIITLWEYYWHTGDREFVAAMMPVLQGQLEWLERHVTPDRLLEVSNTWSYTLPRAGVLSGANMVLAHALECAACLMALDSQEKENTPHLSPLPQGERKSVEALPPLPQGERKSVEALPPLPQGERVGVRVSSRLREWAGHVRKLVTAQFYDPALHLFNDRRRAEGWDGRTWEDNNAQAILLDIAPPEAWDGILANLKAKLWRQRGAVVCDPMFTLEAIQNENRWAHNGVIWPFVNAYEAGAWMKAGHIAEGLDLLKRFTGACADAGTDTIWEMLYPDGRIPASPDNRYLLSMCHAWGATGNYYLMRYVLGVEALEPGFGRIRITPNLGPLEWARGVVPTPHGPISVECRRDVDGVTKIEIIEKPQGVLLETGAPVMNKGA